MTRFMILTDYFLKEYHITEYDPTTGKVEDEYSLEGESLFKAKGVTPILPTKTLSASLYIFDTLQEAVDFAASKTDNCPAQGEVIGYKKAIWFSATPIKGITFVFSNKNKVDLPDSEFYYSGGYCIVTLRIPSDARRTGCYYEKKCRAEFAEVLKIEKICEGGVLEEVTDGYAESMYFTKIQYRVGETVYADSFDDNKAEACSHGVHFFLEKEDAIAYY